MGHQFTVEEKNKEAYFIRIPKDMYQAIREAAEGNKRSIQLQSHILLGAALNRNLLDPGDMGFNEQDDSQEVIAELRRQIEFLQKTIDTLALGRRTTITYVPSLPGYTPYWMSSPNISWASRSGQMGGSLANGNDWSKVNASFSVDTSRILG